MCEFQIFWHMRMEHTHVQMCTGKLFKFHIRWTPLGQVEVIWTFSIKTWIFEFVTKGILECLALDMQTLPWSLFIPTVKCRESCSRRVRLYAAFFFLISFWWLPTKNIDPKPNITLYMYSTLHKYHYYCHYIQYLFLILCISFFIVRTTLCFICIEWKRTDRKK